MKVFELQDWSMEHLRLSERADPRPGPGQVLLRMKAASLNYRDLLVMKRGYGGKTGQLPLIPVSDGVGEVVETGAGVTRVGVGDRVCPMFMQGWISGAATEERLGCPLGGPLDGVMADFMLAPQENVCKIPAHLSDEEAATLPCAALTAWSALFALGEVTAGDQVLVQGTGGVSIFALQFAKLAGAKAIITSSSDQKLERARTLGADVCLNYRTTPEWGKAVIAQVDSRGVDHILDVGGAQTLPQSLRAIRIGGTISLVGVLSGANYAVPLAPIIMRQVRVQGITVGNRDQFEAMSRAIEQHRLRPVVDRTFPFRELRAALEYLASGAHFGKVCIRHHD